MEEYSEASMQTMNERFTMSVVARDYMERKREIDPETYTVIHHRKLCAGYLY